MCVLVCVPVCCACVLCLCGCLSDVPVCVCYLQDYDVACAPALAKIARDANQEVPDWLEKWASKAGRMKQDKNWKVV